MNGEDAVESITDLSDQSPETAPEQVLSVSCMEVEPQLTGISLLQEDHGLKRKHCEISEDTEVGEKKFRFQGDETKEANYEAAHVSTKLSATLKASFFDESDLPRNNKISDNEAVGNLSEDGKKGRRRKRGQRKNKASESLTETEKPLEQTSMDLKIENNAQKTLIAQKTEDGVTKIEKSVPNVASVGSKPFPKLTENPKPKADKIIYKPIIPKPKPQETAKSSENPKQKEKQQLNDKKVVTDSVCLEIQSEETNSKSVPSLSKPKRHEEVFMYGNYSRYYGYRSPALEEDVRLSCFPQTFFQGKDVLDIGCNIGHVTLLIARDWRPKRIVGLDIDGKLIGIAKKNVKHYIGHKSLHGSTSKSLSQAASNNGNNSALQPNELFPNNVMFMQGNYVLARDDLVKLQKEEYDVILALSISKWIHLNFGDDGLKRTFQRVYRQLRPGGKFILEPQEWSSYKKKKKLTETIFENFKNIKFRPDTFRNYLLSDDVGFSSCEMLGIPNNKSKGFRRPLLMFIKGSAQSCNESLVETEQRNSATDEYHSVSTCSTDAMTEKAIVESGEQQSCSSKDFSEVANTHVLGNTENGAATLNASDFLITQDARNEDHSVSTCLRDSITENTILHCCELQSSSSKDFFGVANTYVHDYSEDGATAVNVTDILITKGASHEDISALTCLTNAMTEDAIVDCGEEQPPILQDFSEGANTHVNGKTKNGASTLNATDMLIMKRTENESRGNVIINIGEECDMSTSASDAVTCDVSTSANDAVTCDVSTSANEIYDLSKSASDVVTCDASNSANDVQCDVSTSKNDAVTWDVSNSANKAVTCDVSTNANAVTCDVSTSANDAVKCDMSNGANDAVTCDASTGATHETSCSVML